MSIPALRFKEFSSDWEEKTLGDIGENIIGLTYSPSNITDDKSYPIVLRSSNIKNDMLDLNDQVRVKEKIPEKLFTNRDDILICTRNGSQRLIGKNVLISNTEIPMTFGAFMSVYRSPFNKFMVHLFKTDNYNEQIQMNLGARINQITTKNLNAFSFWFPSLQEQTKIANFLTAVDEKITLLTQKASLLSQYKKGVMQQIFKQELRFKDDDGQEFPEWEIKKLSDENIYISDGNYGEQYPKASEFKQTGVPFIRANNMSGLALSWVDMKFINHSLHEVLTSGHLETDDILVTTRGDIGMVAYVSFDFNGANINAQICLIRVNDKRKINSKYLAQLLSSSFCQKQFKELQTGSALKQLPKKNLSQVEFYCPIIEEQTKIANFLTAIDEKITTNQTQLNAVKQYKQGLLQQMFV